MGSLNSIKNVVGERFERLVVLEEIRKNKNNRRQFLCKCDCGNEVNVLLHSLRTGHTKSCGCLGKEKIVERNTKHGYSQTQNIDKLYFLWLSIKRRCSNSKSIGWKDYGGRGITVCKEWEESPEVFIDWCNNNGYEEGLQIDRINNDGNYEPFNCRFVTNQENSLNKRLLMINNKTGYSGVYYKKANDKFVAKIGYNGKFIFDKAIFKTAQEAALARDIFIIKNELPHKLNFPELAYGCAL